MPDSDILIEVGPASEAISDRIEQELLVSLRTNMPPSDYDPFTIVARNAEGALVAGLDGSTAYGWLAIKTLWVAEAERGRGLGARLVRAAEAAAASRNCHGAWLDTSSARAMNFYRRLGYESFGTLENEGNDRPTGHRRFFMSRRLSR